MGLPIWRDPDEKKSSSSDAHKSDPTACARSSIRRRPSVHGRRVSRPRLPRDLSTRFERSPPPHGAGLSETRLRAVPPISTLLESADRQTSHPSASRQPLRLPWMTEWRASTMQERSAARPTRPREPNDAPDSGRVRNTTDNGGNSPTIQISSSNIDSLFEATPTITLLPRPSSSSLTRSPQPMSRSQSRSRRGAGTRRVTLPTPPLDISGPDDAAQTPETATAPHVTDRRSHPLSNFWRPGSSIDGLGDRDRSPIMADGWDIIRATITPDETLPSADSSFTSAAASQSFNAGNDAGVSESSSSSASRLTSNQDSQSDSVSSVDPNDLVCTDEDVLEGEAFALEMFRFEAATPEGRERIDRQTVIRDREGNRFGLPDEPASVDLGFRLIDEALDTPEGRQRLDRIRNNLPPDNGSFDHVIAFLEAWRGQHRSSRSGPRSPVQRPWSPHPERYGEETLAAARDASRQVQTFFARSGNTPPHSSSLPSHISTSPRPARSHRPRPTTSSRPAAATAAAAPPYTSSSDDESSEHHGHRVSERDASEALLSGDVQDLDSMRRIVERLAARDDVPEEWWMSMGLNLSRARPRQPRRPGTSGPAGGGSRVQSGRIARSGRLAEREFVAFRDL